jgi:putative peptidoglycan lipid II flippase
VAAMLVNVAGDLTLGLRYGITGLAASTSLSLILAAAANTWLLRRRHQGLNLRPAASLLLRSAVLACVAGGAGLLARELSGLDPAAGTVHALAVLVCVAVAVLVVYAGGLLVARAPEGRLLLDAARSLRRPASPDRMKGL